MLEKIPKWTRIVVAVLIVAATFAVIIPLMIAGTPCYEVFVNLPPAGQQDKVVEVFNWQGAYGKPWELEGVVDAHLGDTVAEWWGEGKFGVKIWVELDKVAVLYNWNKITGAYDLIGMVVTLGDPVQQEAHNMDVWEASLVPNGDGTYSNGTFTWLGAEEAQKVVDTLTKWVEGSESVWDDAANPVNEDKVKAVISGLDYFKDRADKPHITD